MTRAQWGGEDYRPGVDAQRVAARLTTLVDRPVLRPAVRRLPWPRTRSGALLFHHVADADSSLTAGLGVTTSPSEFTARLEYGLRHHRFVDLDGFLAAPSQARRRPLLLTFDDAYASVPRVAAPLCHALGIPAVFFVNGRFVDNHELALDNLVAHVVNTVGFEPIVRAAGRPLRSFDEVLGSYVPSLPLGQRVRFQAAIADFAGVDPRAVAAAQRPYVTTAELGGLAELDVEVGNHTATHVHCRVLQQVEVEQEVVGNQRGLEARTGRRVRAFAFPYGHRTDATEAVVAALRRSGHVVGFVVHGRLNTVRSDPYRRPRISLPAADDRAAFAELELLPRLRALRPMAAPPVA